MSRSARSILTVVVALALVVAAFLLLRPGDGDDGAPASGTTATTPAAPAQTTATGAATVPAARPRPRPRPAYATIVVRGLEPVGGVKRIELRKGDVIRIAVRSDQPEEIHLHGYDESVDVVPGEPARLTVPADLEGIFEVELEHAGVQIAEVVVNP